MFTHAGRRPKAPIPPPQHAMHLPPAPVVPSRQNTAEDSSTQETGPNVHFAQHTEVFQNPGEIAVELEGVALGESAVSENGHEQNSEDEHSVRSEISQAPSVEHYNISFEYKKTFREHKGARVMKPYHKILKLVYNQSLMWSYNILLFVLGLFLAVLWAVINALVAFLQTWGISPLTRVSLVIVRGLLPIILEPLGMLFKTCATACGCGAGCLANFPVGKSFTV